MTYNPSNVGRTNQGIFGLPHTPNNAEIIIIPVPWEATASYGSGTSLAPNAILKESPQLDLYHIDFFDLTQSGITMLPIPSEIKSLNDTTKKHAKAVINALETGSEWTDKLANSVETVNQNSQQLNQFIYQSIETWVDQEKLVVLLGGDHSISWPYIHFVSDNCDQFGILQIDAHMDLRDTYCSFTYSHASVMRHAANMSSVSRLVQVGVRDYCEEEVEFVKNSKGKIKPFFEHEINTHLSIGKSWDSFCKKIINALPERVYITVDIDGLDPSLCPNTGTPVPGGLTYQQISFLLEKLSKSNKKIIGIDLVEVGNNKWDANVGARLLYQLCGWFSLSANKNEDWV